MERTQISINLDHVDCIFDDLKQKHREEIAALTAQMESELKAMKAEYEEMLRVPSEDEEKVIKLVLNGGYQSLKVKQLTKVIKNLQGELAEAQKGTNAFLISELLAQNESLKKEIEDLNVLQRNAQE